MNFFFHLIIYILYHLFRLTTHFTSVTGSTEEAVGADAVVGATRGVTVPGDTGEDIGEDVEEAVEAPSRMSRMVKEVPPARPVIRLIPISSRLRGEVSKGWSNPYLHLFSVAMSEIL